MNRLLAYGHAAPARFAFTPDAPLCEEPFRDIAPITV